MRIVHKLPNFNFRPVVALGTFDGVHLGHRKIIDKTIELAKKLKTKSAVITFTPHPQQLIVPERGLRLLTTLVERINLFSKLGIDYLVIIGFSKRIQKLSYRNFTKNILVKKFKVKQICVGYDFAFGSKRKGHIGAIKELGKKYGFKVNVVHPVKIGGIIVKSSKIRNIVSEGRIKEAADLLSHPYRIIGRVVKGSGRGKVLGFPTANLRVDKHKLVPAHGVYCGWGYISTKKYKCVVNIGARPTFADGRVAIEVHIIGFDGNLRGKTITVDFVKRLRGEIQFSDVEKLKGQIKKDILRAQKL